MPSLEDTRSLVVEGYGEKWIKLGYNISSSPAMKGLGKYGLTQIPRMEKDCLTFAAYSLMPECFNSKISPGLEYRLAPTRPMDLRRFGSIFPSAQTSSFM
jgi:hypothetical protein